MCMTCEGATFDDVMRIVADKIHEHTVTFVPVEGGAYAYTVGMTGQGMPELYADTKSGFDHTTSPLGPEASIALGLEEVARRLIAEGEGVTTGTRLYAMHDDGQVEIRFRSWGIEDMGVARTFYAGHRVTALRVVRQIRPPQRARTALQ